MPKFKTKKKKAANYRKITEPLPQEKHKDAKGQSVFEDLIEYLSLFLVFLGICLIFFMGYVYINYDKAQDEKRRVVDNFLYWQDVVRTHPNLTDAYYNAGLYAVKMGDNDKAVIFLSKALELDPDFTKARELKNKLTK